MTSQLLICVLSSERPLDSSLLRVSRLLPGIDLAAQELPAVDAPVQALATEDADLDLRHVQPACMLGRVVEFDVRKSLAAARVPSTSSKHFLKWVFRLSSTKCTRRAWAYAVLSN